METKQFYINDSNQCSKNAMKVKKKHNQAVLSFKQKYGDSTNLKLKDYNLEYNNTAQDIERYSDFAIMSYVRQNDGITPSNIHTQSFDNCFESGNSDQIVSLIIKESLVNYKVATMLVNDGPIEYLLGWCWCASEHLLFGEHKQVIPPQELFNCLIAIALTSIKISSNTYVATAQKYQYKYPTAYKEFCKYAKHPEEPMNQPVFYIPGSMHLQDTVNPETMLSHIGNKSISEYQVDKPNMVCIEFDDAMKQIEKAELSTYIEPKAQAITEERWYEMLGVLPPCKWASRAGVEFFHISERMTGDIVSWYTRAKNGQCATFMDLSTIPSEKIIIRHREAFPCA